MVDELFTSSGAGEAVAESSDMFISSVGYCTNVTTSRTKGICGRGILPAFAMQCYRSPLVLIFPDVPQDEVNDVSTTGIRRQVLSVP
mmetsp:Transcript_718/g.1527  ORF Transcript_718/g.1527 Transcript_718/m.1527 type:complete len:87 (+) Transcript_718:283-543(+)